MIPYEELVAALARWRARQGLPTGLGDYLGESAPPAHDAYAARDHSRDDVVELGDEQIEGMIESQPAHGGNGHGDEHDLPDIHDGQDLVDDGGPGSEETTRPAGLAGLIDAGSMADPDLDAALDQVSDENRRDAPAEPKPVLKGRSRGGGRRRRK